MRRHKETEEEAVKRRQQTYGCNGKCCDKGNVDVLIAPWNEEYFNECENFPQSKFKDMVDASSSAFTELESGATYSAPPKDSRLGKSSYWNK